MNEHNSDMIFMSKRLQKKPQRRGFIGKQWGFRRLRNVFSEPFFMEGVALWWKTKQGSFKSLYRVSRLP